MIRFNMPTDQNNAVIYNSLGVAAMLRRAWREASYYLLASVISNPDYWQAFFNLGNSWARLGESDAALWAYEQALRSCDDYAPLFLNLGILHCSNGKYREALPYLEQSYRLSPQGVSQAVAIGYVWFRIGEYALAWHWYRHAYRLSPKNRRIRQSLMLVGEKILACGNRG
jgi:tetratricopeptide (TPR) repeat protein